MIKYTDPLFSIIVFLTIIAISILIVDFLGFLKDKSRIKSLKMFLDKFEFLNDDDEVKEIVKDKVSINALLLLAMVFEKEGNYEKSLNIYLEVLKNLDKNEKFDVLKKVANVYFKAGFLHKARISLLEVLKTKPRDKEALKLLLVVDDKLKNYDEMENIIEIFEILEVDVNKEKGYVLFQKAMFDMDREKLKELYKQYPYLKRSYVEYMLHLNPKEIFDNLSENDVYEMLDIFYNYDSLPDKNDALIQVKAARKEINTTIKSHIFELEVLKNLPKDLADLEFEYICENCKYTYPIYEVRCPNCKELFTLKVEPIISEKQIKYRENYN
jgi:lipopolysaccharide biosynthesis regulator YciM